MSDEVVPGKVCINCRLDCSTRPRVKDRAGRYVCRDCLKQMKATGQTLPPPAAARASPPAPSKSEQDVMAALVDEAVTRQPDSCPHCGVPSKKGAVLCLHCGYNRETGKTLHTRVLKERAPKQERRVGGGGGGGDMGAIVTAVVSLLVFGGVFALALTNDQAALAYVVLQALFGVAVGIVVLVFAFSEDAATGFLTLCAPFYVFYFVFAKCENTYVKALFSVDILASLGVTYLKMMGVAG